MSPRKAKPPGRRREVDRRELLDEPGIARSLRRIAHQVVERNRGIEGLVLVGVRTGGVFLAHRLAALIGEIEGVAGGSGPGGATSVAGPGGGSGAASGSAASGSAAGGSPGGLPPLPVGVLDIALYRDDVAFGLPQAVVRGTELDFPIEGRLVLLVDDVLYTGRTVRAALDELMDFGRPRAVQLAVLVDRGLRELPVQADYVGIRETTSPREVVRVLLRERGDDCDRVLVREIQSEEGQA